MELKFLATMFVTFFYFFVTLSVGGLSTTDLDRIQNYFLDCLSYKIPSNITLSDIVLTSNNTSYSVVFKSTIQNLRCATDERTKPLAIITPFLCSHVQFTVICSVKAGIRIRIRSGGHDYEGLSYTSIDSAPFILLDLNKLRSVKVNKEAKTAWVESGATLGELAYWVSKTSNTLGFPSGECTSVGVGGHLSGGGFGMLARKYGLSVDNVIDALIVDANGRILDRDSMGEDLFWAIRGGGGGSFGVILSWKINLVYVPPIVTVFSLSKILDKHGTHLVNKWQYIAHNVTEDLFINLQINPVVSHREENKTMQVTFNSLFLGTADNLITVINHIFPELGLREKDCIEMSWIESVVYYSLYLRGQSIDTLKERKPWPKTYFKVKSDYVKKPIPEVVLEELWKWCLQEEEMELLIEPHGGRMSMIDKSETPYPHREGNLYLIQYNIMWQDEGFEASERRIDLIRKIYAKLAPFVSKNPREAYLNFRDMDVGINGNTCGTNYLKATKWGSKYFMGNFKKLAMVKGLVDPTNFFCYEQSIPPLVLCNEMTTLNGNQNAECYNDAEVGFYQSM